MSEVRISAIALSHVRNDMLDTITSRKNKIVAQLRELGRDRTVRRERGQYLCDGRKLLVDALAAGALVDTVLWAEAPTLDLPASITQYQIPADLLDWVSPLKNSPGPVFSVAMPQWDTTGEMTCAIALEGVQDPGNVGTVLRTANALGVDAVVLTGACADLYHPKTVRATMGAIFRQPVLELDISELRTFVTARGLSLYGAALTEIAQDIRRVDLKKSCVVIGSEGRGLSRDLLQCCDGQVILPMEPGSESLNAAVAAALVMWQMCR